MSKLKSILTNNITLAAMAFFAIGIGYSVTTLTSSSRTHVSSKTCSSICVDIGPKGMIPTELAIKTGQYVQFNTADNQKHNLALGDGQDPASGNHDPLTHDHIAGIESGEFGPGEAWKVQFKKAGTYLMHDHDHPTNRILVVVYNPTI